MKKPTTKKELEKLADKLWSQAIYKKYGGRCAYSGQEGTDAHHIFHRSHLSTRWDVENGILLSRERHTMSTSLSAHETPAKFLAWARQRIGGRKFDNLAKKSQEVCKYSMRDLEAIITGLKLKL